MYPRTNCVLVALKVFELYRTNSVGWVSARDLILNTLLRRFRYTWSDHHVYILEKSLYWKRMMAVTESVSTTD